MKSPLQTAVSTAFARRSAWRERFLAIAREAETASPAAFRPPVSPFRRIPLAGPRARS